MLSSHLQTHSFTLQSNKIFELFLVSMILLSVPVIGAKTYYISSELLTIISFLGISIMVFFLIVISIRFTSAPIKGSFFSTSGVF